MLTQSQANLDEMGCMAILAMTKEYGECPLNWCDQVWDMAQCLA